MDYATKNTVISILKTQVSMLQALRLIQSKLNNPQLPGVVDVAALEKQLVDASSFIDESIERLSK